MILVFGHLFKGKYVGLAIWPFIILKSSGLRSDQVLLNHERIHLRQQLELFVLPFYVLYLLEWTVGLFRYGSAYRAYRNVSFEREAYAMEGEVDYLESRPVWAFRKYICSTNSGENC